MSRHALAAAATNTAIAGRYYQERAIRNIAKAFEDHHQRKALLVMATGAGKTRTVIALSDVLMRANWAKRILFLADRVALVKQAVNAFKAHLPDVPPVNLVSDRDQEGRVYVSTYPTMMGLIDEMKDGVRRFGPGYFDLIVVDEAHRSIYQKYAPFSTTLTPCWSVSPPRQRTRSIAIPMGSSLWSAGSRRTNMG
jgi:type I restriction enzyme R subunit